MEVAARHDLLVLEDTCQGIGGGYEGRKLGTIGHAGAFSFNYYKNMTAGEGGAVCTADDALAERVKCAIDPCHFYWQGRSDQQKPFAGNGARASEIMGAMLNVQLDRLPGMIAAMRAGEEADPRRHRASRQPRAQADADEQPRPRLRRPGHVPAAVGRGGGRVRRGLPERDRRQDRAPQLHRVGPGADRRGRRARRDEPLPHAARTGTAGAATPRTCASARSTS